MRFTTKLALPILITISLVSLFSINNFAQNQVVFIATVSSGDFDRQDSPVSLSLENVVVSTQKKYQLVEVKGKEKIPVPFQLKQGHPARLWWMLAGVTPSGTKRVYEFTAIENNQTNKSSEKSENNKGNISPKMMKKYWEDTANPPKVELILHRKEGKKRILVYTKNGKGYVHDNRAASVEAIKKLGQANGFEVDASENPADINEENLKKYHAIVLSNTNNETFDTDTQKLAFQRYIQAGGGLVGIHSASGSERQWPWFWKTLGGKFHRHPPLQSFDIHILEPYHPSTLHLGKVWNWEDECYYLNQLNPGIKVLMAADLRTVKDEKSGEYPANTFGNYFPLAWYQETELGRIWYTTLGHKIEYYSNREFLQHILGGILWTLEGTEKLDYSRATTKLLQE